MFDIDKSFGAFNDSLTSLLENQQNQTPVATPKKETPKESITQTKSGAVDENVLQSNQTQELNKSTETIKVVSPRKSTPLQNIQNEKSVQKRKSSEIKLGDAKRMKANNIAGDRCTLALGKYLNDCIGLVFQIELLSLFSKFQNKRFN